MLIPHRAMLEEWSQWQEYRPIPIRDMTYIDNNAAVTMEALVRN
ncbi:hypothetical protein BRDCF_p1812 [Bacteroidales bacterium CF]|nr:hypothetical protein BRDCF_p1812 [Bacteroidales bacterium CF]